jgi:hypothetical protein
MKTFCVLIVVTLAVTLIAQDAYPTSTQLRWSAALEGDANAQFEVGERYWHTQRASDALIWWQRAAQNGSQNAIKQLQSEFPQHNRRWLNIAAKQGDEGAQQQLADLALHDPVVAWSDWYERFGESELSARARELIAAQNKQSCTIVVPVIARSNASKARYVALLNAVSSTQGEFSDNPVCFAWQRKPEQHCSVADNQQAQCDEAHLSSAVRTIIFADAGRSYTRPKVMVLGQRADSDVIKHEWAHWLGFADEYAMRMPYARDFCLGRYASQPVNIVVTEKQRMTSDELRALWHRLPWREQVSDWRMLARPLGADQWQLGSSNDLERVGLYAAQTCEAVAGRFAWKPVAQETLMERHQSGVWPELYQRLQKPFLLHDSQLSQHQDRAQEREKPHQ